jgi:3-deoxy-D-manno-octulosonic acid kinase
VEPVLRQWLVEAGTLAAYAGAHPSAEALHGRGTVFAIPAPLSGGGQWVVRHYHRGGALASILGDRYLRVGMPRPVREYALGRALAERGVPTPRMVGAAVYSAGAFYRGDLVTERVEGARDLAAVLFGVAELPSAPGSESDTRSAQGARLGVHELAGAGGAHRESAGHEAAGDGAVREAAMGAAGRLIRRAHDAGLIHPDLNLKNILLTAGPEAEAVLLDLDRGRLVGEVSSGARRRMLKRFWRSARKWERRTGRALGPGLEEAFSEGYAN